MHARARRVREVRRPVVWREKGGHGEEGGRPTRRVVEADLADAALRASLRVPSLRPLDASSGEAEVVRVRPSERS